MTHYKGLTAEQVSSQLEKFGENVLPEEKRKTKLDHFIAQFNSPLIYILVIAGVITLLLHEYTDSLVISMAVLVNTILGFYQEVKAEQALMALRSMLDPHVSVMREGKKQEISLKNIVPDDIVVLNQGDRIPADGIILEAVNFSADEAILTGESKQVSKNVDDEVFMGTTAISGRAYIKVIKTGEETRMGIIAENLVSVEEEKTPLQVKINKLAKTLAAIVVGLSALILVIGVMTGRSFTEMFTTSVAVAVASIPEGMAISLTVILAIGMQKILKRKALVRKLVAAETLGSVTVIATDKTGTLTEGKMKVVKSNISNLEESIKAGVFANNLNDPLEIALWEWGYEKGFDPQKLQDSATREEEVPFSSETKYMSVKINGRTYYKGAPEVLMEMCRIPEDRKNELLQNVQEWSNDGLRILALASSNDDCSEFNLYGVVGLEDPVRNELSDVFMKTEGAGIRIMMITGDYAGTAASVWKRIKGMGKEPVIIDGAQLADMNDDQLKERVNDVNIFARVSPDQKLRIVEALRANEEVVALVGDGVNDAPALKKASIGIVVGEASDVSKETADMILLDSNFQTIVAAIEEGRGIFQNLKKVILYLLSDAFTEILLVMISLIARVPLPMTAAQILWINVVTDGFPSIALTVDPHEKNLLNRKPIKQSVSLLNGEMKILIGIVSVVTAIMSFFTFLYFYNTTDLITARTITFASLAVGTLFYVYSVRSLHKPIWANSPLDNPILFVSVIIGFILQISAILFLPFQKLLKTTTIGLNAWIYVFVFATAVIIVIEAVKFVFRKHIVAKRYN